MLTVDRYGYCIFCDDIRSEPGEKLSFIGCYNATMLVRQPFPLQLPKFCFHFNVFSPADQPYVSLLARCYVPGEHSPIAEESVEVPLMQDQLNLLGSLPKDEPIPPYIVVSASVVIAPLTILQPGMIHVRALINGGPDELHLGSLKIAT